MQGPSNDTKDSEPTGPPATLKKKRLARSGTVRVLRVNTSSWLLSEELFLLEEVFLLEDVSSKEVLSSITSLQDLALQ